VGELAVYEPERVAVLGVQTPAGALGGDPSPGDEVVVVGEHDEGDELEGAAGFLAQPGEDLGEAVDAVVLAGDDRPPGDAVDDVGADVAGDGVEVVG
jgi:hypothetical protein